MGFTPEVSTRPPFARLGSLKPVFARTPGAVHEMRGLLTAIGTNVSGRVA